MQPLLVCRAGEDHGLAVRVPPGRPVVIGRAQDCEMMLHDENVSRHHVRVALEGSLLLVEDLGSAHGTLMNGHRLPSGERIGLAHRVILRLAGTEIIVLDLDRVPKGEVVAAAIVGAAGFRVPVRRRSTTVGSGSDCDLVIEDPRVAACHAELVVAGSAFRIVDRSGGVPIHVNDESITGDMELASGDVLQLSPDAVFGVEVHRGSGASVQLEDLVLSAAAAHAPDRGLGFGMAALRTATAAREPEPEPLPEPEPEPAPEPEPEPERAREPRPGPAPEPELATAVDVPLDETAALDASPTPAAAGLGATATVDRPALPGLGRLQALDETALVSSSHPNPGLDETSLESSRPPSRGGVASLDATEGMGSYPTPLPLQRSPGPGPALAMPAPDFRNARREVAVFLHVVLPGAEPLRVLLREGMHLLGGSDRCRVKLSHPSILTEHAEIGVGPQGIRVRGLSPDGMILKNDKRLSNAMVGLGEHVKFGELEAWFEEL